MSSTGEPGGTGPKKAQVASENQMSTTRNRLEMPGSTSRPLRWPTGFGSNTKTARASVLFHCSVGLMPCRFMVYPISVPLHGAGVSPVLLTHIEIMVSLNPNLLSHVPLLFRLQGM